MPKRLTDTQVRELKKWLIAQHFNLHKLHREFSDAVSVANILKHMYPKLIDLHNYPPRSNTQLKLDNWETLNQKVLVKLGLQLSKTSMEKLAKGTPGAIELLLYDILRLEQKIDNSREDKADEQEQLWSENDEIMLVNVSKKVGDAIVQVPQKMILYSIYERTLRDVQTKDAYVNASQQKIAHLENILRLKAERIDELCQQLAKLDPNHSQIPKLLK